jgi:hypothetical protein
MKLFATILNALIKAAKDKWVWLRVVVLVIVGFTGAIVFSTTKTEDCTVCEGEKKDLVEFFTKQIIGIKTEVKSVVLNGNDDNAEQPSFALYSHDTIPKKSSYKKILSKLDSLLLYLDSIKKKDSMKQNSIKTKNKKT